MTQAGLEPSADTYTTLLCGYGKVGDISAINALIQEIDSKEIYLLDKDYLDIIYALAVNGHEQHVPEMLNKLKKAFGYNQDAINLIYRLINKGKDDTALLVLQSMPRSNKTDGTLQPTGMFFVRQLVRANRPLEVVLKTCSYLEAEDMYENSLLLATETSLQLANESLAFGLLKELQRKGVEIRQHYFWPLIAAKANKKDDEGIIDVLVKMHEFKITPSAETIRDFVIPNMSGKSSDIMAKLRQANISLGSSACSLALALLQKNDIEEAAIIVSRVSAYYYPELIKRPLTTSFYKTKNLKAYITILRHVYENLDRNDVVNVPNVDHAEVVGQFLLDLASSTRLFVDEAENILKEVALQGLSISTVTAEKIQDKLGEKMTPEISTLLGKLSSGELTPVALEKKPPSYTPSSQMNIPQLERLIANLTAKNQEVKGLKRQLLTLYYREKELEKMEALLKDLEKDNFVYTVGVYAQLLDLYAYHERLEEAMTYFNKIAEFDKDFPLDDGKIMRLVSLHVKNGQLDSALSILEKCNRDRRSDDRSFSYNGMCWRMLNSLAEQGKDEELNTLFNCLVKNEFLEINNVMLGPLVRVHLTNNDIEKALNKFEWCCNQFRATPWKNELACKLIQSEDAEKLQRLTDLSTLVHGEINSLYDLVFAFVECGRVRQARKILETPGLQNRPQRINSACQRYQLEGMVQPLEGLKDATKDLNHIDRSDIYYQLLLSYIKQTDVNKALGLWTQMQEEDMAPNDAFLTKLGTFLTEQGQKVPFVMPQVVEQSPSDDSDPKTKKPVQIYRQALKNDNLTQALQMKNKSTEHLTNTDVSLLIEKLVQADRQNEAADIAQEMLTKNSVPMTRVFRFLLNKLANQGNIERLEKIGSHMSPDLKKLVSYDNKICHANLVAGKSEQYLHQLEREIDTATDKDLAVISEKFPRGGAVGILERYPELTEKCKNKTLKQFIHSQISANNDFEFPNVYRR